MTDLTSRLQAALARPGPPSSDFDLNRDVVPPEGRTLRSAAVLVAISVAQGAPRVILTKRSSALRHHPGQIAFPGGKADKGDGTPTRTALREAQEEIGLPTGKVQVLGELSAHETVTGFAITPVLALVGEEFDIVPQPEEVAEVFTVPLAHLLNPDNYMIQSRRWRGHRRHYFAVPYGPYYIWGATARMLRALAARMER